MKGKSAYPGSFWGQWMQILSFWWNSILFVPFGPPPLGGSGKWTPAGSSPIRQRCEADDKLLCFAQMEAEHFTCINLGRFFFFFKTPQWQRLYSHASLFSCLHHHQLLVLNNRRQICNKLSVCAFGIVSTQFFICLLAAHCFSANWIWSISLNELYIFI